MIATTAYFLMVSVIASTQPDHVSVPGGYVLLAFIADIVGWLAIAVIVIEGLQ